MVMNILTEGKRLSTCWRRSSDVPLVVDLDVHHPTRKGEGVSCMSFEGQDTPSPLLVG